MADYIFSFNNNSMSGANIAVIFKFKARYWKAASRSQSVFLALTKTNATCDRETVCVLTRDSCWIWTGVPNYLNGRHFNIVTAISQKAVKFEPGSVWKEIFPRRQVLAHVGAPVHDWYIWKMWVCFWPIATFLCSFDLWAGPKSPKKKVGCYHANCVASFKGEVHVFTH